MIDGSTKDYTFAQKRHWRGWLWNRIAERVRPKDSLVIGLFGADGLDVGEALVRGFDQGNLIAIERDRRAALKLRRNGITTIHSSTSRVFHAWRNDPAWNVAVLDFTSDVSREVFMTIRSACFLRSAMPGTAVVAINMLRGRSPVGAELVRNHYLDSDESDYPELKSILDAGPSKARPFKLVTKIVLNEVHAELRGFWARGEWGKANALNAQMLAWLRSLRPEFASYRSGPLVFDSVVVTIPTNVPDGCRVQPSEDAKTVRLIAAARALRTQRTYGASA